MARTLTAATAALAFLVLMLAGICVGIVIGSPIPACRPAVTSTPQPLPPAP